MSLQALILALMLLAASPAEAGSPRSHALLLAPEWEQAAQRAKERRAAWREVFESLEADPAECEAVVFPELLRYSRVQDGVEQAALLALYVQGGKAKADFSVGMFQMKPSFAEQVETAWMHSPLRHAFKLYFDTADNREQRSRRIRRLADERWQCVYLAVFVRLLMEREPSLATLPAGERVRLLATAYNFSFTAPLGELRLRQSRKTFHLDLLPSWKTTYYAYAGIAAEWFAVTDTSRLETPAMERLPASL